jgi:hypothetical protein
VPPIVVEIRERDAYGGTDIRDNATGVAVD